MSLVAERKSAAASRRVLGAQVAGTDHAHGRDRAQGHVQDPVRATAVHHHPLPIAAEADENAQENHHQSEVASRARRVNVTRVAERNRRTIKIPKSHKRIRAHPAAVAATRTRKAEATKICRSIICSTTTMTLKC